MAGTSLFPFLSNPENAQLDRDMSHEALRLRARSRNVHGDPLSVAELYNTCGFANELVRNKRLNTGFAVVWLGPAPQGGMSRSVAFTQEDGQVASTVVCVCCDSTNAAAVVLWVRGRLAATCDDAALRSAHLFFNAKGMGETGFLPLPAAHTKNKEWAATRVAAVVATVSCACSTGVDVLEAVERLAPSDSFVVQHDGTTRCSESAMADVLRAKTSAEEKPSQALMFNDTLRLCF